MGLEAAVESLAQQIKEQHNILPDFEDDGQPKPMDDSIRATLYQAVRELLVNVAKHAQAHSVKISISRRDGSVRISVEDDGVGLNTSDISLHVCKTNGFGLCNIRERLGDLGGSLQVRSEPGHGTMVILTAPLKSEKENTIEN
jgi:signal transduction histidine kinase